MECSNASTPCPFTSHARTNHASWGRSSSVAPETPTRYHNSQYVRHSQATSEFKDTSPTASICRQVASQAWRVHSVGPETVLGNLTAGAANLLLCEAEELAELDEDPEAAMEMDEDAGGNVLAHSQESPTQSYLRRQTYAHLRRPVEGFMPGKLIWPRPSPSRRAIISPRYPLLAKSPHENVSQGPVQRGPQTGEQHKVHTRCIY